MANIYSVIVYTAGLMGLVFQLFGIGMKNWLTIHTLTTSVTPEENNSADVVIKVGLFRVEACVTLVMNNTENSTCESSTKDKIMEGVSDFNGGKDITGKEIDKEQNQAAIDAVFGDFDVLPYLAIIAAISSGLGLVVFTFQYCECCVKAKSRVEIVSLLCWLITVALLAAAVGIGGHLNSFLSNIYSMVSKMKLPTSPGYDISVDAEVRFPWSILLTGIGMGLCFLNVVAIVIDICVTKFKRSTDYWKYGRVHLESGHDKVELLQDSE